MTKVKDEETMQVSAALPRSKSVEKRLAQAEINAELYNAVDREREKRKLTKQQVIEHGMKLFLLQANPAEAKRLGVKLEE